MKRFLLMIVLAVMAAGLISCGKQNEAVDPLPQNEEVEVEKDPGSQTEAQIEEPKEAPSRIELVTGRYDEAQGMPYEYATITAYRSTGDVVWTGGNKEDIDLQTGQSAANDNSYMEQYKAVLLVHPTMSSGYTTEYTLYDIDKNGIPELIVREKAVWYYIIHLTAQRLFQAKKITGVTVTACMRMMATASLFTTEAWDICTLNTFPCFP